MILVFENLWYIIICISGIFYTILDGFDLGVGALHLLARDDRERRIFLNAIGPVWDGNEVWLIIIFGGMFAGFPPAYATICSAFYSLIMVMIAALIFRAVAIEFRSKLEGKRWRWIWDGIFSFSSIVMAFVIGVMIGNLIQGIPLDQNGIFWGSFKDFFNLYTVILGVTSIALFTMHGSIYLLMKTEGSLHDHVKKWTYLSMIFFMICYIVITILTLLKMPHMLEIMQNIPWLYCIALFALLSIANIFISIMKKRNGWAFISSCLSIFFLFALFGVGIYPYLVRSSVNPEQFSLTLYNASASLATLKVIFTVACIGVPLVLAYGFWIYRMFRGKVELDINSY